MKIFLLRHGEIEQGAEKRLIGQTDVPLSITGRSQALGWSIALEQTSIHRIYCSDLMRSQHTAEIIAGGSPRSVAELPGLREINLGQWDGLTETEVKSRFPGEWEKRGLNIAVYRPQGGESFTDLYQRVIPAFESIRGDREDIVIVVGHAGVNRMVLCHVLGMPIKNLFRIRQDYGALNIIEESDLSWNVRCVNLSPGKGVLPSEGL
jgi:probable phosphoglycerate mutase